MENSVPTLPFVQQFVNQMRFLAQESVEKMKSYAKDTQALWAVKHLIFVYPKEQKLKEMQLEKTVLDIVRKSVSFMRYCVLPKKIVTVV